MAGQPAPGYAYPPAGAPTYPQAPPPYMYPATIQAPPPYSQYTPPANEQKVPL